jgi:SepF-like predicted cell division protein (DUF552 family)
MVFDKLKKSKVPEESPKKEKDVEEDFKKIKKDEDEFIELQPDHFDEKMNVTVKIDSLGGYTDTDRIQSMLRNGNVIFLKIRDLREKDINELKRSVDKLRKTCLAMNGDIVGIDEDYLIVTPSFAKIFRGK